MDSERFRRNNSCNTIDIETLGVTNGVSLTVTEAPSNNNIQRVCSTSSLCPTTPPGLLSTQQPDHVAKVRNFFRRGSGTFRRSSTPNPEKLSVISDNPELEMEIASVSSRKSSLSPSTIAAFTVTGNGPLHPHSYHLNPNTATTSNGSPVRRNSAFRRIQSSTPVIELQEPSTSSIVSNGPINDNKGNHKATILLRPSKNICCSITLHKVLIGLIFMSLITLCWVGATLFLKATYTGVNVILLSMSSSKLNVSTIYTTNSNNTRHNYEAPFFTTWFCSMGSILYLPLYLVFQLILGAKNACLSVSFKDSVKNLRDKGFTTGKLLGRCCLFSILWVLTNYLYILALSILGCTEVISLFATNICFVYLLSWVVLQNQFVGIRIVAVILSNTGIALLAYMDGMKPPTLVGVVLAASAAAGSAVYKVLFKKIMGEVSLCQVSIFFSLIGLISTLLFWPVFIALYLFGFEHIDWETVPWSALTGALFLSLCANILSNFGIIITYETFITLGLIVAVPVCAITDVLWFRSVFQGMKLAGIILIISGFIMVLFPSNWPNAITNLIRFSRRKHREEINTRKQAPDLRTGHIGSRLRSPSGRVK
ncbi:solute carrier family 35 member F3 isoform X2 [Lepeophtheirus salmonis]|nr:putative thiamine transporter SLC35F3 isoform X2 [Lepeophtheirus salmonis]